MGGYVGEVIRRRLGGAWVRDGGQPALDLPGGARIYRCSRYSNDSGPAPAASPPTRPRSARTPAP
ncbi:hypothetical protein GCM10017581_104170 [Dactylosporangium matsuzakiense]|uniref:Uncharacterized protein n=1 Tax=Dactylosporangium matsuzakiense TaxID=53360 RepID=A0A9W6NSR5_9ACTN|nr:hypothetical protein GCM10017581_104170 [Dactylosporangium matsuzakiense]